MNDSSQGPDVADAALLAALAAYPLLRPKVLDRFQASTRNDNWLVEDEQSRRYVLTHHLQHLHPGRVEFQLRFQQHLHHNGFPTAEAVETRLGKLLVLTDDSVPWTLSTYVTGEYYDFGRIDQVVEAARCLAQFHVTVESFREKIVVVEYDQTIRDKLARAEENLHGLEELFVGSGVADELSYLRNTYQWLLSEWPLARFDNLPVGWVHGDHHGRNMTFVGSELRGLFDYDDVNCGPLVYDVAGAIYMFGREARGSFRIRTEVARRFVDEYAQHRRLTREELAGLPMMVAIMWPDDVRYYRYCQQLGADLEARLQREISMMRALRPEVARIGRIITEGLDN